MGQAGAGWREQFTRLGDWQAAPDRPRCPARRGVARVQRAIAAMSPSASGGQATRRGGTGGPCAGGAGRSAGGATIYVDLAKEPSYYGLLAAEEINAALPTVARLNGGALKLSEVDFKRFDQSPPRNGCSNCPSSGLRPMPREWYSVVKDHNDADSLAAAEWMRRSGHLGPLDQHRRAHRAARFQPALPDARDEIKQGRHSRWRSGPTRWCLA